MPVEREKIVDRIRKLMERVRLSNRNGVTDGEIETAMNVAAKLMEEYNVEESEVLASEVNRKTAYESFVDAVTLERSQIFKHELFAAMAVAKICDVGIYTNKKYVGRTPSGRPATRDEVHFFGLPTDVAVAKVFYAELCTSIKIMARTKLGDKWTMNHFYYCEGFVQRILQRAIDMKKQSQVPGLVLCKHDMIQRYQKEKLNLGARDVGRSAGAHNQAYSDGWHDGDQYDLGVDNRLAPNRPALV